MESQPVVRFGPFELDLAQQQLRRDGAVIRLKPQPFRLLALLVDKGGRLVTREEIRQALWDDQTFIDFDQGVNFAVRQVRAALDDDAERPLFVETVPRRGYRFIAPIEPPPGAQTRSVPRRGGDTALQKALWANILELRQAALRRQRRTTVALILTTVVLVATATVIWLIVS